MDYAEKSLAVREKTGDLFGTASVLGNLVVSYFWSGQLEKFEEHSQRALEVADLTKDIRNIAWQKVYLAEIRHFRGEFEQAEQYIQEAEDICRTIYDTDLMMQVNINKAAIIAISHEDYQEARRILEDTIPFDAEFSMHTPGAMMAYGITAAGLGEMETLEKTARFPFEAMSQIDARISVLSWFSPLIAYALYRLENYRAAAECLGFCEAGNILSYGWVKRWSLIKDVGTAIQEKIGGEEYQKAYMQGGTMTFLDFGEYL